MSSTEHLVKMAGDIAAFFASQGDSEAAIRGIVTHLERFWDPSMRRKLIRIVRESPAGVPEAVRAAVERLAAAPGGAARP
jgi:formate dehydrogenase subunit delta